MNLKYVPVPESPIYLSTITTFKMHCDVNQDPQTRATLHGLDVNTKMMLLSTWQPAAQYNTEKQSS